MKRLRDWWRKEMQIAPGGAFAAEDWSLAWENLPLLDDLGEDEAERLSVLAERFLRDKVIEPVQGLALTDPMRLVIALQACLPVLELGLDWYLGWYALILYPDAFVPGHEVIGEDGVVGIETEAKSGEAWDRGPVILSWADVEAGLERDGYNVVIHELAHKLDLRDGTANGCPPLHREMSAADWKNAFSHAYADLCQRVDEGEDTPLDPYASESPAEFFAVASEAFFELPALLAREYPAVYAQLRAFYRQDPLARGQARAD